VTAFATTIIVIIGAAVSLAAWWGCHLLAQRMERDDRRDRGIK
jgi:hypothetical protein